MMSDVVVAMLCSVRKWREYVLELRLEIRKAKGRNVEKSCLSLRPKRKQRWLVGLTARVLATRA